MPKMKSDSSAKKRFRFSKKGKVMKKKAGARHIMEHKGKNRKRSLRKSRSLGKAEAYVIKRLLPYS
ncbi:MAG: 50S ribosomal protein L35 [Candidatus Firestonebacteria bacterium RIFOXYC2_FULL_39_67]|nr:MAG: 50S ribosomal protein L35 [Candidatus Firestonebacteria bacterium RIFOXYD2_FULL_39_29]OGF54105.1 MAG: 50S ribosomal protein L35 [Candidatus Firestonebacteria bacterium RIFOXYC2_FULL_39_67]OGF55355.1 MAG: 50S ribosomal protein L35 [Candidatus Firestonebacteria bacterium RifOxyC12_full_39_7]